jgi:hypothetical protein
MDFYPFFFFFSCFYFFNLTTGIRTCELLVKEQLSCPQATATGMPMSNKIRAYSLIKPNFNTKVKITNNTLLFLFLDVINIRISKELKTFVS